MCTLRSKPKSLPAVFLQSKESSGNRKFQQNSSKGSRRKIGTCKLNVVLVLCGFRFRQGLELIPGLQHSRLHLTSSSGPIVTNRQKKREKREFSVHSKLRKERITPSQQHRNQIATVGLLLLQELRVFDQAVRCIFLLHCC
jgi:hypothetical protein